MNKSINDQLKDMYLKYWGNLELKLNDFINSDQYEIKPTNPLLLSHKNPEDFQNSDIKVMILGQENNDWEGEYGGDYEHLLKTCSDFYQGEYYQHLGYFKNHYNLIVDLLKDKFEDKNIGFFWSNVVKIGKAYEKGLPPNYVLDVLETDFNVLQEEINIIKPDIIIFISGPDYDYHINQQIKDLRIVEVENYGIRELAKMEIPNVKFAYRTYHPQKMNFLGKEKYTEIYNTIINTLKI
ncbi:hypothetical protein OBK14_13040 [Empedobacter falsenii]